MSSIAMAVLAVMLILSAAWAVGRIFSPLIPAKCDGLERMSIRLAAGLTLYGLFLFLIGLLIFTPRIVIGLTVALAMVGVAMAVVEGPPRLNWRAMRHPAVIATMGIVFLCAVASLAPPAAGWGNDTVDYHLLGPKVWLETGIVRPALDNFQTAFASDFTILYSPAMAIGGAVAAQLLCVASLAILLGILRGLAKAMGGDAKAANLAALFFASCAALVIHTAGAFTDVPVAMLLVAAIRLLLDAEDTRTIIASAVLLGLALGAKFHAILALPAVAFLVIVFPPFAMSWSRRVKITLIAAAITLAMASPWFLRNWIVFKCPMYPPTAAVARLFRPRYVHVESLVELEQYMKIHSEGRGKSLVKLAEVPINLTFRSEYFDAGEGISFALLAFAPLGYALQRRNRAVRRQMILLALCGLAWFFTAQQARYFTYGLAIVAAMAGIGAAWCLSRPGLLTRWTGFVVIVLSASYGVIVIARTAKANAPFALSPVKAEQHWEANVPFSRGYRFLNQDPTVQRVLILGSEVPPYYLNHPYACVVGSHGETPLEDLGIVTPQQALDHLDALHVTHVLDNRWPSTEVPPGVDEIGPRHDFYVKPSDHLKLVFDSPDARVYQVQP